MTRRQALIGGGTVLGFGGGIWLGLVGLGVKEVEPVDPAEVDLAVLDRIDPLAWERLRRQRICFGHQSVGGNVIAGLREILRRKPGIKLDIAAAEEAAPGAAGLVHFRVGANGDAAGKVADFASKVGSAPRPPDIAIMKLCFVDLRSDDDPQQIWEQYRSTLQTLAADFPQTRFVHVTIPLTTVPAGPKATLRRWLKRGADPRPDNVVRHQYNQLLLSYCAEQNQPVFDLARAEACGPDGSCAGFKSGGAVWPCLHPGLASDRGHLNDAGQLAAARDLLIVLAALVAEDSVAELSAGSQ